MGGIWRGRGIFGASIRASIKVQTSSRAEVVRRAQSNTQDLQEKRVLFGRSRHSIWKHSKLLPKKKRRPSRLLPSFPTLLPFPFPLFLLPKRCRRCGGCQGATFSFSLSLRCRFQRRVLRLLFYNCASLNIDKVWRLKLFFVFFSWLQTA